MTISRDDYGHVHSLTIDPEAWWYYQAFSAEIRARLNEDLIHHPGDVIKVVHITPDIADDLRKSLSPVPQSIDLYTIQDAVMVARYLLRCLQKTSRGDKRGRRTCSKSKSNRH